MGKFVVTTFGKWESQRQKLLLNLISNPEISSKKNKEEISEALFDEVNSAMVEVAYRFVAQHISEIPMRELIIQSYQQSLTVVLSSLSNALTIPENILDPYVQIFCRECNQSIETMIKDIMDIGRVSVRSKAEAIDQLYGENFKTLYPDLTQQLTLQDPEVIELSRKTIEKTIIPSHYGDNESIIREQLIYINEIAPKIKLTDEFQRLFEAKTGLTLKEYKMKVAENGHSYFWQKTLKEAQASNIEVEKSYCKQ